MKKLLFLLLLSIFVGCHVPPPKQVEPNLEQEIAGLQDIPLTNMPGHETPECPLECICPNWFGLDKSPCAPKPEPEKLVIYSEDEFLDAMRKAGDQNKLMLIVLLDIAGEDGLSLKLSKDLIARLDNDRCVADELTKHYVPVLVSRELYDSLRGTGRLAWLPGDYIQSPALMFATVRKKGNRYLGHALPITFEGRINADLCTTLRAFYEVTR